MSTAKEKARGYLFGPATPQPQTRSQQWKATVVAGLMTVAIVTAINFLTNDATQRPLLFAAFLFIFFVVGFKLMLARKQRRQFGVESSTWL